MKMTWSRDESGAATSKIKMDEDGLMTIREAAASIRVTEDTIKYWMRNGHIPFVPVGPSRMIRKADLYARDAADGMPTARPRGGNNGGKAVHTTRPEPEPIKASPPPAKEEARNSPPGSGRPGQGERNKGRR